MKRTSADAGAKWTPGDDRAVKRQYDDTEVLNHVNVAEDASKLKADLNRIIRTGDADEEVIENNFPGFLPRTTQNSIMSVTDAYVNVSRDEDPNNKLVFHFEPHGFWRPSDMELVFRLHYTKVDGTAVEADDTVVNGLLWHLFESVNVYPAMKTNTINRSKKDQHFVRLMRYLSNTTLESRKFLECQYLYHDPKATGHYHERNGRRDATVASTNTNIVQRRTAFAPYLTATRDLHVPLTFLDDFFRIDDLLSPDIHLRIEFVRNTRPNALFETSRAIAENPHNVYNKLTIRPFSKIFYHSYQMTNQYKTVFESLFNNKGSYALSDFYAPNDLTIELLSGEQTFQRDLRFETSQPEYLVLFLCDAQSYSHTSMFDTAFENSIHSRLEKIEITGVSNLLATRDLNLDMTKSEDKYSAYRMLNSFVQGNIASTGTNAKFAAWEQVKRLISYDEFGDETKNNIYPFVIDLRRDLGHAGTPNPDIANNMIGLKITWDAALTKRYFLLVHTYFASSYQLIHVPTQTAPVIHGEFKFT